MNRKPNNPNMNIKCLLLNKCAGFDVVILNDPFMVKSWMLNIIPLKITNWSIQETRNQQNIQQTNEGHRVQQCFCPIYLDPIHWLPDCCHLEHNILRGINQ